MRLPFAKWVKIWQKPKFRYLLVQVALLAIIFLLCHSLWVNLQNNLKQRGISLGFEFLEDTAGFSILMHLIPYSEQSTYLQAFWVGLLNTLLVSLLGIVIATLLGVIIGIARTSSQRFFSNLALGYVELIRNIPLLLQIFFWYFVVLRSAPFPQDSYHLGHFLFISNRGITLAKPILLPEVNLYFILAGIFCIAALLFFRWEKRRYLFTFLILAIGCFAVGLFYVNWQMPTLSQFNFEGGITIVPEFLALLIALSLYTAAFIAEVVRMGINSVSLGQKEAALSLGLTRLQALRFVIIPQAMRVILPPLTNQYLNLTKNSSLAAAIAYPDLVSVFTGTVLNQTGHAVEIISITMGVYLFISLVISALMLLYEKRTSWGSSFT